MLNIIGGKQLWAPPPAEVLSRPRADTHQEGGPFAEGKLVLQIESFRIDWIYTVADRPERQPLSLGPFIETLDTFQGVADRWFELDTAPNVVRIAFGAVLIFPVETREKGYHQISAHLPFDLDPKDASDFSYQINRRRDSNSGIQGLRINRLSKWSVGVSMGIKFIISPEAAKFIESAGDETHFCRLELDVNTVPGSDRELNREEQSVIFQELIDLGMEIAREGEIP